MNIKTRLCLPFARWTAAHANVSKTKDRHRPVKLRITTGNGLTTTIELTKKDAFALANNLVDIAEEHA